MERNLKKRKEKEEKRKRKRGRGKGGEKGGRNSLAAIVPVLEISAQDGSDFGPLIFSRKEKPKERS